MGKSKQFVTKRSLAFLVQKGQGMKQSRLVGWGMSCTGIAAWLAASSSGDEQATETEQGERARLGDDFVAYAVIPSPP